MAIKVMIFLAGEKTAPSIPSATDLAGLEQK